METAVNQTESLYERGTMPHMRTGATRAAARAHPFALPPLGTTAALQRARQPQAPLQLDLR